MIIHYCFHHASLSVCLHGITRHPLDKVSCFCIFEIFTKICRHIPILVKKKKKKDSSWASAYFYAIAAHNTDCILCEVLADTQQKLGYIIIFLFRETTGSIYLSLQDKYRKQYTPPFLRDQRKFRYSDVHEIIWTIIKPEAAKDNDLSVTIIPHKQRERERESEKVVIAFRLYRKYWK